MFCVSSPTAEEALKNCCYSSTWTLLLNYSPRQRYVSLPTIYFSFVVIVFFEATLVIVNITMIFKKGFYPLIFLFLDHVISSSLLVSSKALFGSYFGILKDTFFALVWGWFPTYKCTKSKQCVSRIAIWRFELNFDLDLGLSFSIPIDFLLTYCFKITGNSAVNLAWVIRSWHLSFFLLQLFDCQSKRAYIIIQSKKAYIIISALLFNLYCNQNSLKGCSFLFLSLSFFFFFPSFFPLPSILLSS